MKPLLDAAPAMEPAGSMDAPQQQDPAIMLQSCMLKKSFFRVSPVLDAGPPMESAGSMHAPHQQDPAIMLHSCMLKKSFFRVSH